MKIQNHDFCENSAFLEEVWTLGGEIGFQNKSGFLETFRFGGKFPNFWKHWEFFGYKKKYFWRNFFVIFEKLQNYLKNLD